MDFENFIAGKDDDGRRLFRVLKSLLPEGAQIHQLLRKSLIKLNGKKADASDKVCEGDEIRIPAFLLRGGAHDGKKQNLEKGANENLILENTILKTPDFLIVNKPYDVSVQGGKENLCDIVASIFERENKSTSLSFRPGPLHRLDRKTTGVLVFSQSLEGAKWFSEQLSAHNIKKTYIAIIEGKLEKSERWEDFISSESDDKKDTAVFHRVCARTNTAEKGAKLAITNAIPLSYGKYHGKDVTLAQFRIETGRKHQIRAQSALHGHSLLGDTAYGAQKISEAQDFFLHAYRLEFPENNPFSLPKNIDAFILTNFQKMLNKLLIKWDYPRII